LINHPQRAIWGKGENTKTVGTRKAVHPTTDMIPVRVNLL
jgi:hypothetical protein